MRQDTAPQLAILFDGTRAHAVYTCQQSQFLADRLAASAGKSDCTSAFPCFAGQLVAKGKRAAARGIYAGSGREQGLWYILTYTHAHTAN